MTPRHPPKPASARATRPAGPFPVAVALVLVMQACSSAGITEPTPEPPTTEPSDTAIITVNAGATHQTLDGFGGNAISLVYGDDDHLGAYRDDAVRAAYQEVGVSLGLLSSGIVETPAGTSDPFGQRRNDNDDPFVMAPDGFNWEGADDTYHQLVEPARTYGYTDATLGPSVSMRWIQTWLADIRSQDYQRYLDEASEHVLATVQHWTDAYGLRPKRLELFNEPTSGNKELTTTSISEVVDLVKAVGARLAAAGYGDVKFIVPNEETASRTLQVASAILADPDARQYVGVIGYHPYPYESTYSSVQRILDTSGSGNPDPVAVQQMEQLRALGDQYGLPVWLTEVSEGPGNDDYPFGAMENLLARAIHIHDNFVYAGASAFFGMNVLWDSRTHEEHFGGQGVSFLSQHSHLVLVDVDQGKILITGVARAIGHYARWLEPGAVRIGADSDNARVIATGFRDPRDGRLVVVVVNNTDEERLVRVRLQGAQAAGTVTGESSWGEERWKAIAATEPVSGDEVQVTVAARSVTTVAIPTG